MSLAPGVRLGAYEVSALIGAGGMGQVYRAKDTKLGRDVALKILSHTFTDGKRVAFSERHFIPNRPEVFEFANGADLWIYDIDRDVRTKLTTDPSTNHWPVWSPDGSRLVSCSSSRHRE